MERLIFLATLVLTLCRPTVSPAETFPRPAELEPQIRFWRAIFADYSSREVVLHDAVDLDKIYAVLDFRSYEDDGMSLSEIDRIERVETDEAMDHLRATFRRLHTLQAPRRHRDGVGNRFALSGLWPRQAQ